MGHREGNRNNRQRVPAREKRCRVCPLQWIRQIDQGSATGRLPAAGRFLASLLQRHGLSGCAHPVKRSHNRSRTAGHLQETSPARSVAVLHPSLPGSPQPPCRRPRSASWIPVSEHGTGFAPFCAMSPLGGGLQSGIRCNWRDWHARSHLRRNSRNSSGGRNHTSAAVSRRWRLTSTPRPRPSIARNAASSVMSSPKYAAQRGPPRAPLSFRSAVTTSPLSRPARSSSPASNSSSVNPFNWAMGSKRERVLVSITLAFAGETPRQCITIELGFSSTSPPNASRRSCAPSAISRVRIVLGSRSISRRPSDRSRSEPCSPQTSGIGFTPSSGTISPAGRPVTTTMRVRPWF